MNLSSSIRAHVLGVALCLLLSGCRGLEPPYSPDSPPQVELLLAAASPKLTAVQIPRAKIRQGSGPAANLMLVAQAPARFAGTIQVAGNELVSLAVNEESYGLRWIGGRDDSGSMQPGYYSGPPSRCAVQTLLGVEIDPKALVDVVLGGAPLIDEPRDVVDRGWDRKRGRERLRLANADYEQELEFVWMAGRWQFAGASLWLQGPTGDSGATWLWTIRHDELHVVDGELLPGKTQISQPKPSGKGELVLNVTYEKQVANPSLGGPLPEDPPPDVDEANAGDEWEDDWGAEEGGETSSEEAKPEPKPEATVKIPAQFIGNPTGLTPRGDPCVGRR